MADLGEIVHLPPPPHTALTGDNRRSRRRRRRGSCRSRGSTAGNRSHRQVCSGPAPIEGSHSDAVLAHLQHTRTPERCLHKAALDTRRRENLAHDIARNAEIPLLRALLSPRLALDTRRRENLAHDIARNAELFSAAAALPLPRPDPPALPHAALPAEIAPQHLHTGACRRAEEEGVAGVMPTRPRDAREEYLFFKLDIQCEFRCHSV